MVDKFINIVLRNTPTLEPQEQAFRIAGFVLILTHTTLNLLFIGVSSAKGIPELITMNIVSAIIGIFNIYLYLSKSKLMRDIGGSLVLWNICYYIISSTIVVGANRNAEMLFLFLILVTYSFHIKKKKYLTFNLVVLLGTMIFYYYIKYYIRPIDNPNTEYITMVNDMFAVVGALCFLWLKETVEKYTNNQIKTLENKAYIDFLTGLKNRRYAREYATNKLNKKDDFIVLCDIDFFKKINDNYGHYCGDYVLKEIATILKNSFRSSDLVCRWGGEEFLIYVCKTTNTVVEKRLEEIRLAIEEKLFEYEEYSFNVSMSFGYCGINEDIDITENVKNADTALYYAKDNGRNKVINFNNLSE